MRQADYGAIALSYGGVAGHSPLEWGAGDFKLTRGETLFPVKKRTDDARSFSRNIHRVKPHDLCKRRRIQFPVVPEFLRHLHATEIPAFPAAKDATVVKKPRHRHCT